MFPNIPKRKPKPMWEYPRDHDFGADEGYDAFVRGYQLEDNPYADTTWGKSWCMGWKRANIKWLESQKNNDKVDPKN